MATTLIGSRSHPLPLEIGRHYSNLAKFRIKPDLAKIRRNPDLAKIRIIFPDLAKNQDKSGFSSF